VSLLQRRFRLRRQRALPPQGPRYSQVRGGVRNGGVELTFGWLVVWNSHNGG